MLLRMPHSQGLLRKSVLPGLVAQSAAPTHLYAFATSIAQLVTTTTADQEGSKKPTCGCDPNESCEYGHLSAH